MNPSLQPLREVAGLDLRTFREEIVPAYEPVVIRGLVADWPSVRAAAAGGIGD